MMTSFSSWWRRKTCRAREKKGQRLRQRRKRDLDTGTSLTLWGENGILVKKLQSTVPRKGERQQASSQRKREGAEVHVRQTGEIRRRRQNALGLKESDEVSPNRRASRDQKTKQPPTKTQEASG